MEDLQALSPREDRRAGAILGLAVGDALGATYEFCALDEVPARPLEMVGGGWLDLEPGETTDDTALTTAVLVGYDPISGKRVLVAVPTAARQAPGHGNPLAISTKHLYSPA